MYLPDAFEMAKRVKGELILRQGRRIVISLPWEIFEKMTTGLSVKEALSDAWEVHGPDGQVWK